MSATLPLASAETWWRPSTGAAPLSPLASARIRRRLTVEDAAARARLEVVDARALEEARIGHFASPERALAAALVYAAALDISAREARRLAGLPGAWRPDGRAALRRLLALLAFALAAAAFLWAMAVPDIWHRDAAPAPPPAPAAKPPQPSPLPEPWEIQVDVLNGTARGSAAAGLANEIAGLAYRIGTVHDADRADYAETRVYFPPGGEAIARRLADQLGVGTTALPGGNDPRRLVVIVGRSA
jgi:hypothetical protein